jgi:hypothetical protein
MRTQVPSLGFKQGAGQFAWPPEQLGTLHLDLPVPLHWKHGLAFSPAAELVDDCAPTTLGINNTAKRARSEEDVFMASPDEATNSSTA